MPPSSYFTMDKHLPVLSALRTALILTKSLTIFAETWLKTRKGPSLLPADAHFCTTLRPLSEQTVLSTCCHCSLPQFLRFPA